MSFRQAGASCSDPPGIRAASLVSWTLAGPTASVIDSVRTIARTSWTIPWSACMVKRGVAADGSVRDSRAITCGETFFFGLRIRLIPRCPIERY
jgi:hypothetical protein